MSSDSHRQNTANAAAEEVLRVIYGDDLQGCNVSLDQIAEVIATALREHVATASVIAELHLKGFEAVQLLATPPAVGSELSPEDLRSMLSERLDSVREVATKIIGATREAAERTSAPDLEAGGNDDV